MLRFVGRQLLCVATAASTPSPDVVLATAAQENKLDNLSPKRITEILDQFIVGQADGKKAVAISLRNRWRRRQLADSDLRHEVMPKNILLIGPTGVGKTEIARRMARMTDAPFVKVEATKYTEVGFKGKDAESIIEDLYTNAKVKAKKALSADRNEEAMNMTLDAIYSAWVNKQRAKASSDASTGSHSESEKPSRKKKSTSAKEQQQATATSSDVSLEYFKLHYTDEFKDDLVTVELAAPQQNTKQTGPGGVDLQSVSMLLGLGTAAPRKVIVTKKVSEAVPLVLQDSLSKLIDENSINTLARALAEEDGVVFIDEIDKVVVDADVQGQSGDVSSTGVQQDLLPLVEGSNVTMKDGSVIATDNILFICSGAFHVAKTSSMIAELQGRLPVRVELKALTEEDFRRILTEPKFNLLLQQQELLKTEKIDVVYTDEGIAELARVTCLVNSQGQNIGARRLNTVLERVMDEYSFNCEDYEGKQVTINEEVVKGATEKMLKNVDLAKYLL